MGMYESSAPIGRYQIDPHQYYRKVGVVMFLKFKYRLDAEVQVIMSVTCEHKIRYF